MNAASPSATVFVVHWNRPEECAAAVHRFLEEEIALRLVVIDNASTPENLATLRKALTPTTAELITLPKNLGWGGALNVALKPWLEAGEDFCFISAHDAIPAPGCLQRLLEAGKADARLGLACPQYPDRSIPHLSRLHGVRQSVAPPGQPAGPTVIDVPHGTLMMARRQCLQEIGLFDERYFAYGDEHDLGARATRAGWKVVLLWGATVVNPGTWVSSPLRSYFFARNSLLLVHDHFGRASAFLRAGIILVSALRQMVRSKRDRSFAFSLRAQGRAIADFYWGRFGAPSSIR